MAGNFTTVNCSTLATRSSFPDYIQKLRDASGNNFTLLGICNNELCNALWGTGNADISGIGMIFGYLLETFLGFSFALGLEFIRSTPKPTIESDPRWQKLKRLKEVLLKGYSVFFECAIYFAASIQIACVVVLVRKDFGISVNGLGGLVVQITWAVTLLSMLPLLYPLVMLGIFVSKEPPEC